MFLKSKRNFNKAVVNEQGFFIEELGNLSSESLLQLLHDHPQSFSPNVILRPLYQEVILPNLCYVGGVGESAEFPETSRIGRSDSADVNVVHVIVDASLGPFDGEDVELVGIRAGSQETATEIN